MARILSVEDDEQIQRLIGKVLFREGYEMHYAWNGQEGFEKVLSVRPDLIILDLVLPLVNGVEFLERLRTVKEAREIPVIVVTGFGDEAQMLRRAVEALGAQHFIRKPLDLPELVLGVKAVLGRFPRRGVERVREAKKGAFRADLRFRTLWIEDRLVAALPHKEFALALVLLRSRGPLPKEKLLRALGYLPGQGDALKQTMHRLRVALGASEGRRLATGPDGYELIG